MTLLYTENTNRFHQFPYSQSIFLSLRSVIINHEFMSFKTICKKLTTSKVDNSFIIIWNKRYNIHSVTMHKLGCDLKKVQYREGGFRASGKSVVAFGEGPKFCFILYTIFFFRYACYYTCKCKPNWGVYFKKWWWYLVRMASWWRHLPIEATFENKVVMKKNTQKEVYADVQVSSN